MFLQSFDGPSDIKCADVRGFPMMKPAIHNCGQMFTLWAPMRNWYPSQVIGPIVCLQMKATNYKSSKLCDDRVM